MMNKKIRIIIAATVLGLSLSAIFAIREQRKDKSDFDSAHTEAAASAIAPAAPSGEFIPKETWAFAGYATPEAALGSWNWAMMKGNAKVALESVVPEMRKVWEPLYDGKTEHEIAAEAEKQSRKIMGYQILRREDLSAQEAVLEVQMREHNKVGPGKPQKIKFQKIRGDWKVVGPVPN